MPRQTFVLVTGIKDVDRRLKALEPRLQKKALRQSMRAGLKVMRSAISAEAPVDSGLTRRSVKVRALKKRKRGEVALEVRIAGKGTALYRKSERTGKAAFYPALVEYGRLGVPADPFMRRAFDSRAEEARQVTISALRSAVDRAIDELHRS